LRAPADGATVGDMRGVVMAAALLAAGCAGSPGTDWTPRPAGVEPARGYAVAPAAVVIRGDGFYARASEPSGGGAPALDSRHRAWLDEVELSDVTWRDVHTLVATVPPGLSLGPHALTVEGPLGERGTLAGAYLVVPAPALAASGAVDRAAVNLGQDFTVTVTLANAGGAELQGVVPAPPAVTSVEGGAAELSAAPSAPPAPLAPGEVRSFSWSYRATGGGWLEVAVSASAVDGLTGAPVDTGAAAPLRVAVQRPAALAVAPGGLAVPAAVPAGADFDVVMTVANAGAAEARDVTPGAVSLLPGSTAGATYRSGPRPASASIPGGGSATFTWTFTAGRAAGSLQVSAAAAGTDVNTGARVASPAAQSNPATVRLPSYLVTVTVTGAAGAAGGVISSPAGVSCVAGNVCAAAFEAGTGVTLTATTTPVSWVGCDAASGATCTLQALAGPRAVLAAF
jgi:hypothetical protein